MQSLVLCLELYRNHLTLRHRYKADLASFSYSILLILKASKAILKRKGDKVYKFKGFSLPNSHAQR